MSKYVSLFQHQFVSPDEDVIQLPYGAEAATMEDRMNVEEEASGNIEVSFDECEDVLTVSEFKKDGEYSIEEVTTFTHILKFGVGEVVAPTVTDLLMSQIDRCTCALYEQLINEDVQLHVMYRISNIVRDIAALRNVCFTWDEAYSAGILDDEHISTAQLVPKIVWLVGLHQAANAGHDWIKTAPVATETRQRLSADLVNVMRSLSGLEGLE